MKTKTVFYDLPLDAPMPEQGNYLVSIGKKGVGQVMLMKTVRLVKPRYVRPFNRYALTVVVQHHLKELTEYEHKDGRLSVWVIGEHSWPIVWYPRTKKK